MNNFTKYMSATLVASSLIFTGCNNDDKEPVYGSDSNIETSATLTPYENCLNLISPKAYNDADGLNIEAGSVISMITPTSSTPYWDAVKKGAFQAIEDINTALGYSGKDRITLSFNTASNVDDQINILDSELSRYPAAIALAPIDTIAFGMQFDQAMENGIPIITFEAATTNNNVSSVVATDNQTATQELFEQLTKLSASPDSSFIICDSLDDETNLVRFNTLTSKLSNDNDYVILDLSNLDALHTEMYLSELGSANKDNDTPTSEANNDDTSITNESNLNDGNDSDNNTDDTSNAFDTEYTLDELLAYLLTSYPEFNNFVFLDGVSCENVLDSLDGIELDYSNYNLLSFDTSANLKQALMDGKIDGLQITNPYGTGYASIIASIRASLDLGNEAFVNTGSIYIDAELSVDSTLTDFFY